MKGFSEYRIPFVGLAWGLHYFNYEVDDHFFQAFEGGLVSKGRVFVDLALEKRERVMTLTFDIGGQVHTDCDRCLAPLNLPIHGHFKVYVKTGRETQSEDEDVIIISPEATHLELSQHIYEFIQLSLPMLRGCEEVALPNRPCNWEVLRRLENNSSEDSEPIQKQPDQPVDPRWEKLRSLEDTD